MNKVQNEKFHDKIHEIRGHLSVILSASELALLDEMEITQVEAVSVIRQSLAEVEVIIRLLSELEVT